jgi:hypothetical protein
VVVSSVRPTACPTVRLWSIGKTPNNHNGSFGPFSKQPSLSGMVSCRAARAQEMVEAMKLFQQAPNLVNAEDKGGAITPALNVVLTNEDEKLVHDPCFLEMHLQAPADRKPGPQLGAPGEVVVRL